MSFVGMRFLSMLRRNAIHLVGIGLMTGVVAALLVFVAGPSTKPVSASTATRPRQSSPGANPSIETVKTAVRTFIEAEDRSGNTGSYAEVDSLVAPGAHSEGNAGASARFARDAGYTFFVLRSDFDETSWDVSVSTGMATVTVRHNAYGYAASWPALQRREPNHEGQAETQHLQLRLVDGRWLVSRTDF